MKKFLIFSAIGLLAAGCNPSQSASQNTQNTPPAHLNTYTMTDVQAANSRAKCWTVINNNVYDLTKWIDQHPGGDQNILKICGKDGTQAFEQKHGGQKKPAEVLKGFEIGTLK